ncbi:zinc-ribbon domain-containing protein [Lentzea fradiae]|uniref:Zinc-ribbon domain-containing protein n=1 Tax=Lentzea fradiae TaxID=200378 RepID=A0A1G8CRU7_9PSEU|nr:zinc-ribbon domain-containing protein [Lentzea fradiae]SDH48176.1 zinc-ribbon domain-containing protein [Lentzea fradiae]
MAVVRSCPQCGASVQDGDDFCGNCGTYLGWTAEATRRERAEAATARVPAAEDASVAEVAPTAPVPRDDSAGQQPVDRSGRAADGKADEDAGPGMNPPPVAEDHLAARIETAIGEPGPVEPGSAVGGGLAPESPATARPGLWARWHAWVRSRFGKDGTPATGESAAASDRPVVARVRTAAGTEAAVGTGPSDVVLGPVLPGRPEARRPLPTAGAQVEVAGPPCPVCGTTNPPGRRFCRRCATPLQGGTAVTTARPHRRSRLGDTSKWLRRLAALLVVAALVVAGIVFYPNAVELVEDLRDRLAKPAPIAPVRAAATAEVPGHPAGAAVDGLSNRYWGAPAVGDAIEFTFDRPFRLLSVVVHTGASAQPEQFREQARPTAVDLVVTGSGGVTRTIAVALNDQPGPQRTDTGVSDVVAVRLVVKSAAGLGDGRHVALGEVEFFRRS